MGKIKSSENTSLILLLFFGFGEAVRGKLAGFGGNWVSLGGNVNPNFQKINKSENVPLILPSRRIYDLETYHKKKESYIIRNVSLKASSVLYSSAKYS